VLVRGGERGTGKELIAARRIPGGRWDRPLVKVNCAALPESLLETELFAMRPGLPGAMRRGPGASSGADGGSLFMNEIASASPGRPENILASSSTARWNVGSSPALRSTCA
jgi:psp operon transcriptional activator